MELWKLLGDLHPKLVQFPIVLLLAGLIFDVVGLAGRSARAHWAGRACAVAGTVGLLFAFICGIYAEIWAGRAGTPISQIEWHEFMANVASWGFVVLVAWRLFIRPGFRKTMAAYVAVGLGFFVLLTATAWLGGKLVFEYGAAVTGARADGVVSLHDLNTLACRQTDANLAFSEMMHHIFGWLTLAMAAALIASAASERAGRRLRWVGPALLAAGGCFLLFAADLDLYALTDPRQWHDREVQLHKLISVIMMAVGGTGAWNLRGAGAGAPRGPAGGSSRADGPGPSADARFEGGGGAATAVRPAIAVKWAAARPAAGQASSVESLAIAVMALIGGGLLFTHVHTVAPYANVAAGVYIYHVVLGLTALVIGGAKLLEDAYPSVTVWRRLVFPVLLACEAGLLITYNEGLPWFIGYGHYNRWGAGGEGGQAATTPVAPMKGFRAELRFDPATGHVEVHTWENQRASPVRLAADRALLTLSRGYEETAVRLRASDADGRGLASAFEGDAPSMAGASCLGARVAFPDGAGRAEGYFDPWVTGAVVPVPPNEVARYQCPMHEAVRADQAGQCPLCGMPLVPVRATPPATLHDDAYAMTLTLGSPRPAARAPVTLTLSPREAATGRLLTNLVRVHTKWMHLIVVSEDLGFFDHVHPVRQADGSFTLSYVFPTGGRYLLFADVTPAGERSQVFRMPVEVGDAPAGAAAFAPNAGARADDERVPLEATPAAAQEIGGYHVQLVSVPRGFRTGVHTQLIFRLSEHGRPVTDLSPYVGAMGHLVMISDDGKWYVHAHPELLTAALPDDARGGPDVAFDATFAHPGRYKVWPQFRRGDRVVILPFVIDVRRNPVPAWMERWVNYD